MIRSKLLKARKRAERRERAAQRRVNEAAAKLLGYVQPLKLKVDYGYLNADGLMDFLRSPGPWIAKL